MLWSYTWIKATSPFLSNCSIIDTLKIEIPIPPTTLQPALPTWSPPSSLSNPQVEFRRPSFSVPACKPINLRFPNRNNRSNNAAQGITNPKSFRDSFRLTNQICLSSIQEISLLKVSNKVGKKLTYTNTPSALIQEVPNAQIMHAPGQPHKARIAIEMNYIRCPLLRSSLCLRSSGPPQKERKTQKASWTWISARTKTSNCQREGKKEEEAETARDFVAKQRTWYKRR